MAGRFARRTLAALLATLFASQLSVCQGPSGTALPLALPEANAATATFDLPRILHLADRNHPNILLARAKLQEVRAQLYEAYFTPFSQFKLTGGVALAPTVRGNNVFSPNTDVSL